MKPTFLNHEKPLLTVMLEMNDLESIYGQIRQGNTDGADAYGVELNRTPEDYLNEQTLREIFQRTEGRPIYVTCYPKGTTACMDASQREDLLLMAYGAGATLLDISGGWYDLESREYSTRPDIIEKQTRLSEKFHKQGAEVLISSHFYEFLPQETVTKIADDQIARGADVVKIISWTGSRQELSENLATSLALKGKGTTFLFASNGPWCKPHRSLAPFLGSSIVLCTQRYAPGTSQVQPLLKNMRSAMELLPWQEPAIGSEAIDAESYKY